MWNLGNTNCRSYHMVLMHIDQDTCILLIYKWFMKQIQYKLIRNNNNTVRQLFFLRVWDILRLFRLLCWVKPQKDSDRVKSRWFLYRPFAVGVLFISRRISFKREVRMTRSKSEIDSSDQVTFKHRQPNRTHTKKLSHLGAPPYLWAKP